MSRRDTPTYYGQVTAARVSFRSELSRVVPGRKYVESPDSRHTSSTAATPVREMRAHRVLRAGEGVVQGVERAPAELAEVEGQLHKAQTGVQELFAAVAGSLDAAHHEGANVGD